MNQMQPPEFLLFTSHKRKACDEHALALQSQGIPSRVAEGAQGWALLVHPDIAAKAREQLVAYGQENVDWPPKAPPPPILSHGRIGAALYAIILLAIYPIGQHGLARMNWHAAGMVDADKVMQGEWWRTITALTLHADVSHLAGNLVFGIAFAILASHLLGSGLTWFSVVLAGALGNVLNSYIYVGVQAEAHRSIGASTAVFGCLGLMSGYEWLRRKSLNLLPMRRLAPVLGAGALLGFLGTAGDNTDVGAHLAGALVGGILGLIIGALHLPQRLGRDAQALLGIGAALLLALAWAVALRAA